MNRTPMKRSAWPRKSSTTVKKSRSREQRLTDRAQAAINSVVAKPRKVVFSTTVPPTVRAVPKTIAHRNKHLRELARGMPCLLRVRGVCNGDWSTTVACHSNLNVHGKGGARKADDQYSVWGCCACHQWLDQGKADGVLKETTFMRAHLSQVLEWRAIALDAGQPSRSRVAVEWALGLLNSSPLPVDPLKD